MEIKITPCINGAYIETKYEPNELFENENSVERYVYQFSKESSLEGLQEMFYEIMDTLGVTTGKREKNNLYLVLDNGYDYCGKDANIICPHCDREYEKDE